jgi:hypothetical protein
MTKRIQTAIDIFLDAINEGTLAKGSCAACAVGNLVAYGMDAKIVKDGVFFDTEPRVHNNIWGGLFCTVGNSQSVTTNIHEAIKHSWYKDLRKSIKKIEFTIDELAKIEYTFETNTKIIHTQYDNYTKEEVRADQIKGLEAVVKLMLTFDEQVDDVKEIFTKKAELIPLI